MRSRKCEICGEGVLEPTTKKVARTFGGRTFDAELPAMECSKCGEVQVGIGVLLEWDRAVIRELATSGPVEGSAFKFLRTASGLQAKALAGLLDVTPGTVSRWEHGRPIDRASWVAVATLALEHLDRRNETLHRLRALAKPARKRVHLKIAA